MQAVSPRDNRSGSNVSISDSVAVVLVPCIDPGSTGACIPCHAGTALHCAPHSFRFARMTGKETDRKGVSGGRILRYIAGNRESNIVSRMGTERQGSPNGKTRCEMGSSGNLKDRNTRHAGSGSPTRRSGIDSTGSCAGQIRRLRHKVPLVLPCSGHPQSRYDDCSRYTLCMRPPPGPAVSFSASVR